MKKTFLVVVALNLFQQPLLQAQQKIDSLSIVLSNAREDTSKVNILNELAYEFRSNNPDTAIYFANEALALATKLDYQIGIANAYLCIGMATVSIARYDEALKNSDSALRLYNQLLPISTGIQKTSEQKILKQKAKAYNNIGNIYSLQGSYPEALKNHFAALSIRKEIGDKQGIAGSYNNIGTIYQQQGNYPEALKNNLASLKIQEELGNKKGIANSYTHIGVIYDNQGNYPEALKNHLAALSISEQIGDKQGIAGSNNNIGVIYREQGNYPEALKNYFAALKINEEIGNKSWKAKNLLNIGNIYALQRNYSEALKNFFASLKIKEEIGDKQGMGVSYNLIGEIYTEQKKNIEASKYLNKGLSLVKEIGSLDDIKASYNNLAKLDSAEGNFKQALEHYQLYITYRDSVFNEENTKKLVQSQMQYEFDKKEAATKAEQDKKDAVALADLQKQKVLKYSFVAGALLLLVLALVLYNRYRLKQKANKIITAQKEKVEQQSTELQQTLYELKQRQQQLVQSEKMASVGVLTAGIAHEINNPINFVSSNVSPLKRNFSDVKKLFAAYDQLFEQTDKKISAEKLKKEFDLEETLVESENLLHGIEEGANRTASIVKGLRNFSRLDEEERKLANINEGIESTLILLRNKLNEKNISVEESLGNIPEIECYPAELNQVFMNLLANAMDAIGKDGKIFIATSHQNNQIKISIRDTGIGMSDEVKQKIFDPFFTTKDVGKGTGLGLSISYGIIEKHNGTIGVNSEPGAGTEFVILLSV